MSLGWQVISDRINAYYDAKYNYPSQPTDNPQVTKSGSIDVTYNCYAYATGKSGQSIDDGTLGAKIIFEDDYSPTTSPYKIDDVGVSASVAAPYHGWKVTDVKKPDGSMTTDVIVQTKEKNQISAIYTETYSLPTGLVPSGSDMVRKK